MDLDQLARFFCNPSKVFLRDRLGLRLPEEAEIWEDCEPLELRALMATRLQGRVAALS